MNSHNQTEEDYKETLEVDFFMDDFVMYHEVYCSKGAMEMA